MAGIVHGRGWAAHAQRMEAPLPIRGRQNIYHQEEEHYQPMSVSPMTQNMATVLLNMKQNGPEENSQHRHQSSRVPHMASSAIRIPNNHRDVPRW